MAGISDWVSSGLMIGGALFLLWAYRNKQFPFDILTMMPAAMAPVPPGQQPVMMMMQQGGDGMMITTPPPRTTGAPTSQRMPGGGATVPTTQNLIPPPPVPKPGPNIPAFPSPGSLPFKIPMIPLPTGTIRHSTPITVAKHTPTTMTPTSMPMMMQMQQSTLDCSANSGACCGTAHKGTCHSECNRNPSVTLNTPGISDTCRQCLQVCGSYNGMCPCSPH